MVELVLLVVIGTSIWVAFDAPQHGLSWSWGLGCLALWILAFPWYLVERQKAIQARGAPAGMRIDGSRDPVAVELDRIPACRRSRSWRAERVRHLQEGARRRRRDARGRRVRRADAGTLGRPRAGRRAHAHVLPLCHLAGHLEAGQIVFSAERDDARLSFRIESWARSGDRLSDLLYDRLRMSKEIQFHMWTSFLERVIELSGGERDGGLRIHTRRLAELPDAPLRADCATRARSRRCTRFTPSA
jgi:hypothetical protein